MRSRNPHCRFVFVDDGSTDETFDVLSRTAHRAPEQLHALKLDRNVGKAEAVRRGVLAAFESSPELIGFWDADLATPLYNIEEFATILEQPDLQLANGLPSSLARSTGCNGWDFATIRAGALRRWQRWR